MAPRTYDPERTPLKIFTKQQQLINDYDVFKTVGAAEKVYGKLELSVCSNLCAQDPVAFGRKSGTPAEKLCPLCMQPSLIRKSPRCWGAQVAVPRMES